MDTESEAQIGIDSSEPKADAGSNGNAPANRCVVIAITVLVVLAIVILIFVSRRFLSLGFFSRAESDLKAYYHDQPVVVYAAAFLIYVLVTGLSIPGATAMSLAYAWFFGFVRGLVLISFASTAGATLAFLLSRYLFRSWIQQNLGDRLEKVDAALETDGLFYLFSLRTIPAFPFWMINGVMGLTRIKWWEFWWVSQLGMLPMTAVYAYAGSRVPDLHSLQVNGIRSVFTNGQLLQLTIAIALVGVIPWVMKKWLGKKSDD